MYSNEQNTNKEVSQVRKSYHTPEFVNLGEIQSLVLAFKAGCNDAACACTGS